MITTVAQNHALARVLNGGIIAGSVLIAAGASVLIANGTFAPGAGIGVAGTFAGMSSVFRLDGVALVRAGVLVLILTPVLRVAFVAVLLARRQDRTGVISAVAVLLLLALATALDLRH